MGSPHPHTGFGASGRMAAAVNPLRVDGRRSAANVQVCGWGHPPASHYQAAPIVAAPGRGCITTRSKFGSRRSNSSAGGSVPRTRTRAPTAGICRRRKSAGDDRTRSRSAAPPQAERHAAASFPSAATGEASPAVAGVTTDAKRGPFGFSRWGRGKRFGEGASASSRSPRSPKETHPFFADRRTRVCGKHSNNNQHIQSRPEKP